MDCRQVKAAIFLGTGQPNCLRNQAACVHACEQDVEKLSFSTVTARCSKPNAGYHAYAVVSNHCAMQQALLFSLQPSPAHRRPSRELLAQPPRCVHFGVICSAFTSPSQSRRPRTKVECKRRLQRQQMAAQQASSTPVLPRCKLHLYSLRWTTRAAGPQSFDHNGYLHGCQLYHVPGATPCIW